MRTIEQVQKSIDKNIAHITQKGTPISDSKEVKNAKPKTRHKWGDYFRHNGTFYQKCTRCGLSRIPLMSIMHYSKSGEPGTLTTKRVGCE